MTGKRSAEFIVTQKSGIDAVYRYLVESDVTLQVIIKPYKPDRSKQQNALLHAWFTEISKQYHLTHGCLYSPKVWKEYFKQTLLGEESIQGPRGLMVRTIRTRDLKVDEMSEFMERIMIHCADELGIVLREV